MNARRHTNPKRQRGHSNPKRQRGHTNPKRQRGHTNPKRQRGRTCPKRTARKGAAAVEFALLLPLLCTITLGMMEIGRGTMVSKIVYDAAQNGAQVAALHGASNSTVTSRINTVLTANNITAANATIAILVNDVAADCSTAKANDKITVTVSIAASQTNLTNFSVSLFHNMTFSGSLKVLRQN